MSLSLCLFLGQFRIFHRQSNCLPSPNLFIETIAPVDRSSEFKKFLNPLEENKKRKREKGCNRIRISKPAGFLFSIATPFLCFFLSLFPSSSFRISCDAVYLELCIPTRLCVHKGREEDERDANRRRTEQVEVRSRWKLRNSISILEQRTRPPPPFLLGIPLQLSWTCQEEDFLPCTSVF